MIKQIKIQYLESIPFRKVLSEIVLIAGSLESANSSILAARRHFKEVVGKKSGFYYNELGQSQ